MPKQVNPRQANMVNDDVDMIAMVSDVCAMISDVNGLITPHPMITDPPPTDLLLSLHQGRNLIMNSREEENKLRDADTQAEIHFSQDLTHLKATCSCQKDSQENRSSSTSIGDHWPMLPHITTAPVLLYTLNFKSSSHAQSSNDALDGHYDSIA
ncbi:hypothetical protein Tco_0339112 [Tanacetum coccineum]